MSKSTVTVDFHNTLIECDSWFELEVQTLVSAVLDWAIANNGGVAPPVDRQVVDREYRKLRLAIHAHGHELEAERATVVVLDRLGITISPDVVTIAVRELMRATLPFARPVAGAPQFLEQLRSGGARIAVVSSAVYHPFLEWALEDASLLDQLDTVVTSASCGFYKSRPEIYWTALEALGATAKPSVHVGDSLRFDIGGAGRAGMKTAWFNRSNAATHSLSDFRPDLVVTELATASQHVLELASNDIPLSPGFRSDRRHQ
jgi:FMN phosphatase YigB (HAD superfamily)